MAGPRGPRHMMPVKADKSTFKMLFRVFSYVFKHYKWHCLFVAVLIFISSVANVIANLFLKELIDVYIKPAIGKELSALIPLLKVLIIMGGVYYSGAISSWLYNRIMLTVTQGTLNNIRKDLFSQMEKLPVRYFDTHQHGDIMSIYTNDTDTLRQLISNSLPQIISSVVTVISVFISMISISLYLTFFAVLMVTLMTIVTKVIGMKSGKNFVQQQKNLGQLNGYIEEMMEGQKVIKVFNHEEKAKCDFESLNETLFYTANNANKYANILMPIMGNLGHINYVITLVAGSLLAIFSNETLLTLGGLVAFLQLNKSFTNPVTQLSMQFNSIIMAMAGAQRIFGLMDEEKEFDEGYVGLVNAKFVNGEITETDERTGMWAWKHPHKDGTITYTQLKGDVEFENVTFGYNEEKIVLKNININAKAGEKVAFVGATGAGKTTITNLINRFYDIQSGKIRYDGINIQKIKKPDLRRSLGIVLQDTNLFSGTVYDNIRLGRLDATDEEIIAAAKLANAHSFIELLPDGYDTVLKNNGSNLSQGQRQLLSIARAAVADPPVLILDEATSSIDTRTETIVQRGMDSLMKGRTVFVIAHRLSTVKNSDVIMVLNKGEIIERGTHNHLIEERGNYYQLYTGAFELE